MKTFEPVAAAHRSGKGPWGKLLGGLLVAGVVALVSSSRADAPVGRYTPVTAQTVTDAKTGLVWQRVVVTDMTVDNSTATDTCSNLVLGGFNDYRLPDVKELLTLVDETRSSPALDTTAFPNTPVGMFWTTSPQPNSPTITFTVDFFDGATSGQNFLNGSAYVRCVRGG